MAISKSDERLNRSWWTDQIQADMEAFDVARKQSLEEVLNRQQSLQGYAASCMSTAFDLFLWNIPEAVWMLNHVVEASELALKSRRFDQIFQAAVPEAEFRLWLQHGGPKPVPERRLTDEQHRIETLWGEAGTRIDLAHARWFLQGNIPRSDLSEAAYYLSQYHHDSNNIDRLGTSVVEGMLYSFIIAEEYDQVLKLRSLYFGHRYADEQSGLPEPRNIFRTFALVAEYALGNNKKQKVCESEINYWYQRSRLWYMMSGDFSWQEAWAWAWLHAEIRHWHG